MKCEHGEMPKQERPRTLVRFSEKEVAEALHNYASKIAVLPTGEMRVRGLAAPRDDLPVELVIKRAEGQDVWPPEADVV